MGKIRHIAYRAADVEAMAAFFSTGLGMEIVERRPGGAIDLSDGTLNITLLPLSLPGGNGRQGIDHIGFTVEDETAAKQRIEAAGGREMNTVRLSSAHYELKFEGPEGIVVDLGHWAGTAPVAEPERASEAR
jgi:catechol 2,3-dioxygenase-like lactoylglutathione lyase family enzyme